MLLVNQTLGIAERLGIEKAVEVNKSAGFDALDFTMTDRNVISHIMSDAWRDFANDVKRAATANNIGFVQAHAPVDFYSGLGSGATYEQIYRETVMPHTVRAIEVAAELGVQILVVHPVHYGDYHVFARQMHDMSMAYYRELIPYCREYGVRVALENMWQRNRYTRAIEADTCSNCHEFAAWIDELDSEYITGCLDIGHCGLVGEDASEFIRTVGADRLGCLHVHDNDFLHDLHTLPGVGKIDWHAVTGALSDIGYSGNFTYEAHSFFSGFEDGILPSAVKFMHDRGRQLIKMIEQ